MGLRAIAAVRPLLKTGAREEMAEALSKSPAYRFPNARPDYIVKTREFFQRSFGMRLREQLASFEDPLALRDWLAREPNIKGLGYKEASHFLRNIGFRGYGILDKHVLRCLAEVGVIESPKPPAGRARYLETEQRMRQFAREVSIDFDELDLVLWSLKTGEVLR
jgi:N-glycosylase/DNA lyase